MWYAIYMTVKKVHFCAYCDKPLNERHKKYCDNTCQHKFQNEDKISRWLSGECNPQNYELPTPIRQYLLEEAEYKCTQCGWSGINPVSMKTVLTIDHIDGNADNNTKENLRVLCPNCHALTPTFGGLNKGNGRSRRYKK